MPHMSVCKQVSGYLLDKSFPSIVLIQGPWGCGKTFITKNYLVNELPKSHPYNGKEAHYISLYGITSLDDFRSKLLSLTLSNNSNTHNWLSSAKHIIGNGAKIAGDKGATLGLMDALSQSIKHSLLSKLKNTIVIVDDLERATSEKLMAEVLGECLNLAENNINLWVIVVANEDKIEDKSILEKTFIDRVSITNSSQSIVNFIDKQYPQLLSDFTRNEMLILVEELKLTNYRLIQRIAKRFCLLKKKIDSLERVDKEAALIRLVDHVTRVCHAHYTHGHEIKDILKIINLTTCSHAKTETNSASKISNEEESNIFSQKILTSSHGRISNELIDYCINMSPVPDDIIDAFDLPLSSSLRDMIISSNFHRLNNNQLSIGATDTIKFILSKETKDFFEWLKALDSYVFLIENNYIDGIADDIIDAAKAVAHQAGFFKLDNFSALDKLFRRSNYADKVKALYDVFYQEVENNINEKRLSELHNTLFMSWDMASLDIYQEYSTSVFLVNIDIDLLIESIVKNWSVFETIVFGQHLAARYVALDIYDFLGSEFPVVEKLKDNLSQKVTTMSASAEKGKLTELLVLLERSVSFIEAAKKYAIAP